MLIGSEKPLWGEFNKLLYCIVLSTVMPYYKYAYMPIVFSLRYTYAQIYDM